VEGICGAVGPSLWAKATWDKQFANNMVIVCTAEVLVQCLMHSFISISMINLLIFDEAHHTKSNHPYARLIKDYYLHEPDVAKRPRIFGMTASPVDANVDVRQAAMELETLLHCKIATTSDLSLLANHITRPEEEIARYSPLLKPFETPFHQELRSRYGHVQAFQKLFHDSKFFSSELGPWASDVYWSFAFSEDESRKIQLREERVHHRKETKSVEELDKEIKELQEAAEYVKDHNFGAPNLADLSSKVAVLNNYLQGYYERTADSRCIVFVERRQTARLLSIIFKYLGGPNLHGEILVGNGTTVGDQKVSVRTQFLTIKKFRKGELNCLFATSVAEEGLDIPQCNLVVRFDLYKTMIGYVQSRGRARHRNSKYLHMVEMGNPAHQSLVANSKNSEQIMRNFCNGLSSDRIINEIDDSVLQYLAEDLGSRSYTDPISGAKLSYRSSLAVLGHFVACLPTINHDVSLQPSYVVSHQGGKFICEVILPDCSPIISMMGRPCRRKVVARCSAAFEVCMELRRRGLLDENLLSTQKKSLPAMRNALLAITSKKKDLYDMRIKPEYWQLSFGAVPQRLYLTVVDLSAGLERPHQPLGLITRAPFPQMPDFPIYLVDGQTSNVITIPLNNAFPATEDRLNQFTTLTLQVYEDIFAKTFEIDIPKMSYWLVPLLADRTASVTSLDDPELLIDWDQVHEICEKREYRWTPEMTHDFLANKYIVDINDGGRRFYSVGVIPYLKARSPVPGQAPKYKHMKNILDYSISLWKKTRDNLESVWDESQPVIEVEKIPFRRNFLAHVEKDEEEVRWNPRAFVCPQPLRISAVSSY
jgi:endoribonuclease Dicer